jgi:hypothetical protein
MRCSKCGTEGIPSKTFCAECGSPLSNRCSNCHSNNAPGAKFCADCGSALSNNVGTEGGKSSAAQAAGGVRIAPGPQTSEALEGERKTVTALFADITRRTDRSREPFGTSDHLLWRRSDRPRALRGGYRRNAPGHLRYPC